MPSHLSGNVLHSDVVSVVRMLRSERSLLWLARAVKGSGAASNVAVSAVTNSWVRHNKTFLRQSRPATISSANAHRSTDKQEAQCSATSRANTPDSTSPPTRTLPPDESLWVRFTLNMAADVNVAISCVQDFLWSEGCMQSTVNSSGWLRYSVRVWPFDSVICTARVIRSSTMTMTVRYQTEPLAVTAVSYQRRSSFWPSTGAK